MQHFRLPLGQRLKGIGNLDPLPQAGGFQRLLLFLKAVFPVSVGPQAENDMPPRFSNPHQFIQRRRRGVALSEHPHHHRSVEVIGGVVQRLPHHHLIQTLVNVLLPGHLQHPLGQVHRRQPAVAQIVKTLPHQPGAGPGVQDDGLPGHILSQSVRRALRRQPAEIGRQVPVILRRPLVVTLLQLLLVARGIDPLHAVLFRHCCLPTPRPPPACGRRTAPIPLPAAPPTRPFPDTPWPDRRTAPDAPRSPEPPQRSASGNWS